MNARQGGVAGVTTGNLLTRLLYLLPVEHGEAGAELVAELNRRLVNGDHARGFLARLLLTLDEFFSNVSSGARNDLMSWAKAASGFMDSQDTPAGLTAMEERQRLVHVALRARELRHDRGSVGVDPALAEDALYRALDDLDARGVVE